MVALVTRSLYTVLAFNIAQKMFLKIQKLQKKNSNILHQSKKIQNGFVCTNESQHDLLLTAQISGHLFDNFQLHINFDRLH